MRLLLLSAAALALSAVAQTTSVLFIGNSYTEVNDLPNTFRELALSLGDTVEVAMSAPGGYTLQQHVAHTPTLDLIAAQPWDFVVLQEQSQLGALPSEVTYTEIGAVQLSQAIEANHECTYPVFFMTWARENGDPDNCANWPSVCTYAGMQQGLRANYIAMAEYNDGYVSPVGTAWGRVRDLYPAIALYQGDGSHPTAEGTYLAACVFYATLFQASCAGASFTSTLSPATAALLQDVASTTVLDDAGTWNLDVPNGTDAYITGASGDWHSVTYSHPGQGTHWWACTNGQTSTEANPTFVFDAPGNYAVTHIYNDPCGNSDTATFPLQLIATGVQGIEAPGGHQVWSSGPGLVDVIGGTDAQELEMLDLQGRRVHAQRIGPGRDRFSCPAGLYVWRIHRRSGLLRSGKLLVH